MFYDAILAAFQLFPPSSFTGNNQITTTIGDNTIFPIQSLQDVMKAIGMIKEQGEGTSSSADDVDFGTELAHYYRFGEIYHGQKMVRQSDGKTWAYTGAVIPFPADLYPMAAIPAGGYQNVARVTQTALHAFNTQFGLMLSNLQSAWGAGGQPSLEVAIRAMPTLQGLATTIMASPLPSGSGNVYGPNFVPIMPTSDTQPSGPATSATGTIQAIRATKIMIIRHGEKPADSPPPEGPFAVNVNGIQDHGHSLIVQGWQRAGALANFFAPTNGQLQNKAIAIPATVFACTAPPNAKGQPTGLRPRETITPLVDKLKQTGSVQTNFSFSEAQDREVATAAMACDGVVLISWEHKNISKIVSFIPTENTGDVPPAWDGQRFDLVWVFDLNEDRQQYTFSQIPQLLLAGDSDKLMKRTT